MRKTEGQDETMRFDQGGQQNGAVSLTSSFEMHKSESFSGGNGRASDGGDGTVCDYPLKRNSLGFPTKHGPFFHPFCWA